MPLITFLSDYGSTDHYTAAVKAAILSIDSSMQIVDISHDIEPHNIAQGSYVLSSVYKDFPVGSIHLVALNSDSNLMEPPIAIKLDDHFFLGFDNGFFSLISENSPEMIIELSSTENSTFPGKNILAPAAAQLAKGKKLSDLGKEISSFKRMLPRYMKTTKSQLSGHVINVDHYGNLITNLDKRAFDKLKDERNFVVCFGKEESFQIHQNYNDVDNGDCFVVFNSAGFLEIGINKGNATELLGLGFDSRVSIQFINPKEESSKKNIKPSAFRKIGSL
ncbi:SAM hydrolase/SAM-dependent halogenase family protein [Xanthovirga aplysinae]|uniref:SAM hydrolase/SAM-dependent halogenase family protein n=1 Tax=Xanthovirga aplysinae TaxID=2529853 RepID=UPI0012BB6D9F|nr:SAM-dependent chlorinase/fluorinase [Xanthovirga aplysinae]MTI33568.1 S-adenosyl-l-methionine hydroxide adenosyltransferase [Xanthovirga aplysinae]